MNTTITLTILAVYLAMRIGHDTGDHPMQSSRQARDMGTSWRSLLGHVGTYTVCTATVVLLAGLLPGVKVGQERLGRSHDDTNARVRSIEESVAEIKDLLVRASTADL